MTPFLNLIAPLDFASEVVRRRAVTFLVSDFCLSGNFKKSLEQLKPKLQATNKRHDVVAVSVTDPRELELPDVGLLTIEDAETGEQVELDTRNAAVRNAYSQFAEQCRVQLRRAVRSSGVDLLELSTEKAYLPALLTFFSKRQGRR